MVTKLSKVIEAWRAGDKAKALQIAAKFPQLGDEAAVIQRGHQARLRPEFYRELGQDPDELYAAALAAMLERYPYLDEDSDGRS